MPRKMAGAHACSSPGHLLSRSRQIQSATSRTTSQPLETSMVSVGGRSWKKASGEPSAWTEAGDGERVICHDHKHDAFTPSGRSGNGFTAHSARHLSALVDPPGPLPEMPPLALQKLPQGGATGRAQRLGRIGEVHRQPPGCSSQTGTAPNAWPDRRARRCHTVRTSVNAAKTYFLGKSLTTKGVLGHDSTLV